MNDTEIFILNRYEASELAGAILLGKMSRKTNDSYLKRKLTWHCSEEARHAVIWSELIKEIGVPSLSVHDKEGKGYFSYFKEVKDIIDFLCFVHVYELRVPFHFSLHRKWTSDDRIKEVLSTLIKEEGPHLSWLREYLIKQMQENKNGVLEALKKFSEIEEKTYHADLEILESMNKEGKRFADLIREALPQYRRAIDDEFFK